MNTAFSHHNSQIGKLILMLTNRFLDLLCRSTGENYNDIRSVYARTSMYELMRRKRVQCDTHFSALGPCSLRLTRSYAKVRGERAKLVPLGIQGVACDACREWFPCL